MKKIFIFLSFILLFASCENMNIDYKDYDFQAVYFPFQYPVRSLSLGNDKMDNSIDKLHKFNIGISIGGFYLKNNKNWTVDYIVDNSLVPDYLINKNGDTLKVLPQSYYSLNPQHIVTIPKGKFSGLIEVQLSDEFFEDTISIKGNYVIPLKIVSTSADSILSGVPSEDLETTPNRHVVSDWVSSKYPKDYVLFGIKYLNPYHGSWLRKAFILVRNNSDNSIKDTIIIRDRYVERNQIVKLKTSSLSEVTSNYVGDNFNSSMRLSITGTSVLITAEPGALSANGSGMFKPEAESWGGEYYDALYLNYSYTLANNDICEVIDTLIFRDRGIVVEEARPTYVFKD